MQIFHVARYDETTVMIMINNVVWNMSRPIDLYFSEYIGNISSNVDVILVHI